MSSQYKPRTKHLNELLMSKKTASGAHSSKKDFSRLQAKVSLRQETRLLGC